MTRCVWCHLVKAIRSRLITGGLFGFTTLSMNAPYYTPGPGPDTLQVGGVPAFAPLICYEVIFPRFAPRGDNRPASCSMSPMIRGTVISAGPAPACLVEVLARACGITVPRIIGGH